MKNKATRFDKVIMVILMLAPILWMYGNPDGWSYEEALTIPLSAFFFLYYLFINNSVVGINNPLPDGLLAYFVYWGGLTLITSFILPISVVQCYLAFFLFSATFHHVPFIKMYKFFALFCIVFFFVQEVAFQTAGIKISGIIRFLPFHIKMSIEDFIEYQALTDRSCSVFSEPAHFAQFLLPLLAIELFYDKSKYHYLFAGVIGAVLLFLQSGNGLIGLVPILLFALPYFLREKKEYKGITITVFFILILTVGYLYLNSEIGGAIMDRRMELDMNYAGGSRSGFMRVWRGLFVFGDYNLIEKIFGNPSDASQLAHVASADVLMGTSSELYFNAFQKILLNTGIIGVVIFVIIISRIWKNNTICGKAILATLIALSLIAAIYMTHTMILYLVLAESMRRESTMLR